MRFAEVVGHNDLKQKLIDTVKQERVSHSQFFYGPEGNGAFALAEAYAQYLLCDNPSYHDSCGQCTPCKQILHFNYPDLHYVYPVAKVNTKSSDKPVSGDYMPAWKSLLRKEKYFGIFRWLEYLGIENKQAQISVHESAAIAEKLQLKSYSGRYKILMLWMPERMHIAAANKLLKLLEEPPAKTIFLLVGVDPDKILATINSRCQKVYVPKYPLSQVQGFLESEEGLDGSAANVIARLSDGNLSHARRLAERSETYRDYAELFKNWVRTCYNADVKSIVDWSQNSGRFEREKILDFLTFCSTTFRDTLHIHLGKQEEMNEIFKEINFSLKKFSPFIHLNNTPHILADIDRAAFEISRNANPKLVLMDLSLNLSRHFRSKAS